MLSAVYVIRWLEPHSAQLYLHPSFILLYYNLCMLLKIIRFIPCSAHFITLETVFLFPMHLGQSSTVSTISMRYPFIIVTALITFYCVP